MDQDKLKAIIEQVLREMNVSPDAAHNGAGGASSSTHDGNIGDDANIEDGSIPDFTEVVI